MTTAIQIATAAYAASSATAPLSPLTISRRVPGDHDVLIDIAYCGVCHSDIHTARNEWHSTQYPVVPGHEIVGHVAQVGAHVKKWQVGDVVGVGCLVNSCRTCEPCQAGEEQYCDGSVGTYNSLDRDGTHTLGGYSTQVTVNEDFVVRIPTGMPLAAAAPLLCAGITMYSPLRHFGVKAGDRLAVVGLGGLGHMGVKLGHALGAHVTVLSSSVSKKADAARLGANDFIVTSEEGVFEKHAGQFHFILDTVSAVHDYNAYLGLLKRNGTMILVGAPDPSPVAPFALVGGRKRLAGSLIGGIRETQEMLDFCAQHNVVSDIEIISISQINEAYARMMKNDVRYRFVIDNKSLK